jgi:hypothetical protein
MCGEAITEEQWKEEYRDYEGSEEVNPKRPVIVDWHDPTETPTEAIIRLNGEVVDLAKQAQVEGIASIHWFPGDLVEWRHEDRTGAKVSHYGVVRMSERVLGTTTLWVYVPGHTEPRQWLAAQCRLLRRNSLNKEES